MSTLIDRTLTLDGVAPQRIFVKGKHYHILSASSPVKLAFDGGQQITRQQGQGGDTDESFSEVLITSDAPQTVKIALGFGKVRDNTATLNNANITSTIEHANVNSHLPLITLTAGVATLIAAADVTRKELRLNIDANQPGGVFLGKAGILANQGGFIDVGTTEYIQTQGALYAFNPNATDVKISALSLERV